MRVELERGGGNMYESKREDRVRGDLKQWDHFSKSETAGMLSVEREDEKKTTKPCFELGPANQNGKAQPKNLRVPGILPSGVFVSSTIRTENIARLNYYCNDLF